MDKNKIIIPKHFGTNEVDEFRKNVINLINKEERNFIINFSKCQFIDTTGLGVLLSINKKCMKLNGSLKLCAINNPNVMKVFELTRLKNIFEIGE